MRSPRPALLCLALASALALPSAASGQVTWTVRGAGFGHGVGMSAYGAYGYGLHDYDDRQILDHYFRGIQITTIQPLPPVRVLLQVSTSDVRLTGATRACGKAIEPSRKYLARRRGRSVRLLSGSGKLLARCGNRLRASGNRHVTVTGLGSYRGAIEAIPTAGGSLNVVNALSANEYARGSLPAEIPPEWPMPTLEAFAIAIRSIAASTDVGGTGFDLYSDTRTQVYGGMKLESERTDHAVQATRNQVVTYGGQIAQTTYFSSSGGITESGFLGAPPVPYIKSVNDPYDYYSPLHRWALRFSQAEMDAKLAPYLRGRLQEIKVTQRGDSPRINWAQLIGTGGVTTIRGDTLQAALGLYDRWAYFEKTHS